MALALIGINYNTAPVEVRERVTFNVDSLNSHLSSLQDHANLSEVAILATCNRTEVYYGFDCESMSENQLCNGQLCSACQQRQRVKARTIDYLNRHSLLSEGSLEPFLYEYENDQMVQHTMRVASGLNSMVIGEPQILGQMKQCFQSAVQAGTIKGALFGLFQHVFSSAKKVRSETGIGNEPVSIAYSAVKLIAQFYSSLEDKSVLLIGAGETIRLISQHIASLSSKNYKVANRSDENALELVHGDQSRVVALDQLDEHIAQADVVVSCTASLQRIIQANQIQQAMMQRPNRRLLLIDLAVPRDIDPVVEKISQVYSYSIDDLSNVINASLSNRQQKIQQADEIIANYRHKYKQWLSLQNHVDTISKLRDHGEQSRHQLIQKYSKKLQSGDDVEEILEQFSKQLRNNLLHLPTATLREAIENNDEDKIKLICELYKL